MESERSARQKTEEMFELNFVVFHVEHLRENNPVVKQGSSLTLKTANGKNHSHRDNPTHPASWDGCRRCRSMATSRSEIAAGVTPEIREACPTDAGLTRLSFSLTSPEKPVHSVIIKLIGYGSMLKLLRSLNLLQLPLNIPLVFHFELNRFHHIKIVRYALRRRILPQPFHTSSPDA
jgi:hypothetical protein